MTVIPNVPVSMDVQDYKQLSEKDLVGLIFSEEDRLRQKIQEVLLA